jgi:hypothetical protein
MTSRVLYDRASHLDFLWSRDWKGVEKFWSQVMTSPAFMLPVLEGDEIYGVTNLELIGDCAKNDLHLLHARGKRQTYSLRIGYVGTLYQVIIYFSRYVICYLSYDRVTKVRVEEGLALQLLRMISEMLYSVLLRAQEELIRFLFHLMITLFNLCLLCRECPQYLKLYLFTRQVLD